MSSHAQSASSAVSSASSPPVDDNERFLRAGFGAEWRRALVVSLGVDPSTVAAGSGGWVPRSVGTRMARGTWPLRREFNNYFCVSLFLGEHRLETDFVELRVLAVDDVGVKVDAGSLLGTLGAPAWAIETSPGNQQWFWILDPPVRDLSVARRLTRLVSNDARDVTRLVRLPVGTNTKKALGSGSGFAVRVVAANARVGVMNAGEVDELLRQAAVEPGRGSHGVHVLGRGTLLSRTPATSAAALLSDDLVGGWLWRWGRVKGLTPNRLGVEIVCPWEHEHTVRTTTGTAYFPRTGGFECHHGHCVNRTGVDLKAWVENELDRSGLWEGGIGSERFAKAEDGDDGGEADRPVDAAQKAIARYVYLKADHRFFDLQTDVALLPEAFNTVEREPLKPWLMYEDPATKRMRMLLPSVWFPRVGRIADGMTHWPGRARVFEDVEGGGGGGVLVNLWRPPLRPKRGMVVTDAMVRPWLELVLAFCANEGPEAAMRILDWFALVVGAPGVKPGWHLVLHSLVHGVGKDMMLRAVRLAVGEANVASPAAETIAGTFNAYVEKRLVVVADLERNTRGAATAHDVYEKVKPFTENTTRMLEVNRKHREPYKVLNASAWVVTSNAEDALPLADTDRRFYVLMSEMLRRADGYYADLSAWIDEHWALVQEWLIQRWETMPPDRRGVLLGRAPGTPGKTRMIRAGEDRVTAWSREQIEDEVWPDLMSSRDLQDAYERAGRRVLGFVPGANKWGSVLLRLGAKKVYGGNQVRLNAGRFRLWAIREFAKYECAGEKDLASAYDMCRVL